MRIRLGVGTRAIIGSCGAVLKQSQDQVSLSRVQAPESYLLTSGPKM